MHDKAFVDSALATNRFFWNPKGEIETGGANPILAAHPQLGNLFVSESFAEVICRKLLTDRSIMLPTDDAPVPFPDILNVARGRPYNIRLGIYNNLTQRKVLTQLLAVFPTIQGDESVSSFGWEINVPRTLLVQGHRPAVIIKNLVTKALEMALLIDPLGRAVAEALSIAPNGNNIDLPWYSESVLDALCKVEYPITSMANWMYAQTLPYTSYTPFVHLSLMMGFSPQQELFLVAPDCARLWKMSLQQFKPAYENAMFEDTFVGDTQAILGLSEVLIYEQLNAQ